MTPARVFISYSHRDEELKRELLTHLEMLRRDGLIRDWHDRLIPPGDNFVTAIDNYLESADIVLVLVSSDFLASRYCHDVELRYAMERHTQGECRVVPVILRFCDWTTSVVGNLLALPTDGHPISSRQWTTRDEAFLNVAAGLRRLLSRPVPKQQSPKRKRAAQRPSVAAPEPTFTREVADAYRMLGYLVRELDPATPNALQCDLPVRGGIPVSLYVTCAERPRRAALPPLVSHTRRTLSRLRRSLPLTGAVIVTRAPTRSLSPLRESDLRIVSYAELLDEALNASAPLRRFISRYEHHAIFDLYVSQRCASRDKQTAPESPSTDALTKITHWLATTGQLYTILGDFGTGKTTFLERLKYELALQYLSGRSEYIPVLLALRDFESCRSLELFVEQSIRAELNLAVSFEHVCELLRKGKLLLMLDGFDEMGRLTDTTTRREHFEALLPLLLAARKSVITCRPAYFVTDDELNDLQRLFSNFKIPPVAERSSSVEQRQHDRFVAAAARFIDADFANTALLRAHETVALLPFDASDIDRYITQFELHNPSEVQHTGRSLRERIRRTYDLEDLATRPILLNMMARTLPALPRDREASPSVIYETYTNTWMNHDYSKGRVRLVIGAHEKREFMKALAWQLFEAGRSEIHYRDLQPHVTAFFHTEKRMTDFIATHIQACSFLSRNQTGVFRFSHKSFLEYFVASAVRDDLDRRSLDRVGKIPLSAEVCFFVGDMVYADITLREWFKDALLGTIAGTAAADDTLQRNMWMIFGQSRISLKWLSSQNSTLRDVRFGRIGLSGEFLNCTWQRLVFDRTVFTAVRMDQCVTDTVEMDGCTLDEFEAKRGRASPTGSGLTLTRCSLRNVHVSGHLRATLKNCEVNGGVWSISHGRVSFEGGNIQGLGYDMEDALTLASVTVQRSVLSGGELTATGSVAFMESVRRRFSRRHSERSERERSSLSHVRFSHSMFLWWDFAICALEDVSFVDCFFLGARFESTSALDKLRVSFGPGCRFALLSVLSRETKKPRAISPHRAGPTRQPKELELRVLGGAPRLWTTAVGELQDMGQHQEGAADRVSVSDIDWHNRWEDALREGPLNDAAKMAGMRPWTTDEI